MPAGSVARGRIKLLLAEQTAAPARFGPKSLHHASDISKGLCIGPARLEARTGTVRPHHHADGGAWAGDCGLPCHRYVTLETTYMTRFFVLPIAAVLAVVSGSAIGAAVGAAVDQLPYARRTTAPVTKANETDRQGDRQRAGRREERHPALGWRASGIRRADRPARRQVGRGADGLSRRPEDDQAQRLIRKADPWVDRFTHRVTIVSKPRAQPAALLRLSAFSPPPIWAIRDRRLCPERVFCVICRSDRRAGSLLASGDPLRRLPRLRERQRGLQAGVDFDPAPGLERRARRCRRTDRRRAPPTR